jgi:hypothetical protein
MATYKNTWVTGLFMSRPAAERAVEALTRGGYKRDEISVLMGENTRNADYATPVPDRNVEGFEDKKDNIAKGVGVGGLVGGSVGAVIAAIAAAGTAITFPGIGLVVAGPIAAALAGAGAGGATGGLVGAIVGAGIPEDHARQYEVGLLRGGIVLGVKVTSSEQEDKVERWLSEAGAERVSSVNSNAP